MWKLGEIVRAADDSDGRYVIEALGPEFVRYRCLRTNREFFKDRFMFFCRFSSLEEYDRRQAEITSEGMTEEQLGLV